MSKEFQRIKEREDVRKQLLEFIGHSIPRAVNELDFINSNEKIFSILFCFFFLFNRLDT